MAKRNAKRKRAATPSLNRENPRLTREDVNKLAGAFINGRRAKKLGPRVEEALAIKLRETALMAEIAAHHLVQIISQDDNTEGADEVPADSEEQFWYRLGQMHGKEEIRSQLRHIYNHMLVAAYE